MYNLKTANQTKYPLILNGKKYHLTQDKIEELIKNWLKKDIAVQKAAKQFNLDLDNTLQKLIIEITNLDGKFALSDGSKMQLDSSLFNGEDFEDYYFIIVHEIVHVFTRLYEERAYLNDDEEKQGFQLSISSEIARGVDANTIFSRIFPKIEFHFNDPSRAKEFFLSLVDDAKAFLNN